MVTDTGWVTVVGHIIHITVHGLRLLNEETPLVPFKIFKEYGHLNAIKAGLILNLKTGFQPFFASSGCLQILPNKFQRDFQDKFNKFPLDF